MLVALTILFIPCSSQAQDNRDKWDIADSLTVRLQPSESDTLPNDIVRYLERRGYTIPQCGCKSEPHNIISGSFGKEQQTDWAVLASKNRVSRILVFWDGSANTPGAIAKIEDRIFLQGDVEGIVFSRMISPIGKKTILRLHESFGGTEPPDIKYQGIDDAFVWKASTVHYFHKNQWIELTGAD